MCFFSWYAKYINNVLELMKNLKKYYFPVKEKLLHLYVEKYLLLLINPGGSFKNLII
jgi:hypothetical protein